MLFIASIVAVEATPAPLPYSAAKAALVNYSKNLSRTVAKNGIRVNCLAPGNVFFPGGSWERHLNARREEVETTSPRGPARALRHAGRDRQFRCVLGFPSLRIFKPEHAYR